MNRPETTLFLLMSVDGKISTGDVDERDFDHDLPNIDGVRQGLQQYYDLEKQTDLWSLNTGRVLAKVGINVRAVEPMKSPVSFVVIDNEPHLTSRGVEYLSKWLTRVIVVTLNPEHPVFSSTYANVTTIRYEDSIDFVDMLHKLKVEHGIVRLTIQSGGTLNAELIRRGLIDHLSIVIAPVLVGGALTSTLMDGEPLRTLDDLAQLRPLRLIGCTKLDDSYLHLRYDVINLAPRG